MLNKMLKYEFKALGRILVPVYGATLIMSIILAIFLKVDTNIHIQNNFILEIATVISTILYISFIVASICITFFIALSRFKKNIFENEGYLTNTLPIPVWKNITAKLISSVAFQIIAAIVLCISGLLFGCIISKFDIEIFTDIIDLFKSAIDYLGIGNFIGYTLETIAAIIFTMSSSMLMFYASISVGHSFNTHKLSKSVGVFIIIYIVSQLLNSIILNILLNALDSGKIVFTFDESFLHPILLLIILFELIYTTVYFAITNYFIDNKLNLQ